MQNTGLYNYCRREAASFWVVGATTLVLAANVAAEAGATTIFTNLLPIQIGTNHCDLPYYSNRDPAQYAPQVTQILISIHGIDYDALNYLTYGIAATTRCPGASTNTLVIAPCLYTNAFTSPLTNADLFWQQQPSFGSQLADYGNPRPVAVDCSPYTALDTLSAALLDSTNFPNLTRMVWFGFSGGGQLINRYAACSTQNLQAAARGIHTRYICGSPSSYLYMDGERPNLTQPGQFYVPSVTAHADYNEWGYGLSNLYTYPKNTGAAAITNLYSQKFVVYCVGSLDTNVNDPSLDISDAAELQGSARLERASNYVAYLSHFYGTNISLFQTFCLVTNVAHDASNVLNSAQGIKSVFDFDTSPVDSDGDGFSDWQEWLAGTDPHNARDYPKLALTIRSNGVLSLSWAAKESRRYQILSTATPGGSWSVLGEIWATNTAAFANSFQMVSNPACFRLAISPQ